MGAEGGRPRALIAAAGAILVLWTLGCDASTSSASPAVNQLKRLVAAEKVWSYEAVSQVSTGSPETPMTRFYLITRKPGRGMRMYAMGRTSTRWGTRWIPGSRLFWLADFELLLKNYNVHEAGREVVAGRPGIVLDIESQHEGRPSVRVVVDEETGILLARQQKDYRGRVTFISRFRTLLLEEEGTPREKGERWRRGRGPRRGPGSEREEPRFRPLVVRRLPRGFEVKRSWFFRGRHHTLFTDGLSWIELSQWAAEEVVKERVVKRWCKGDRAMLRMAHAGVEVRLVGRLDPDELVGILRSLAPGTDWDPRDSEWASGEKDL